MNMPESKISSAPSSLFPLPLLVRSFGCEVRCGPETMPSPGPAPPPPRAARAPSPRVTLVRRVSLSFSVSCSPRGPVTSKNMPLDVRELRDPFGKEGRRRLEDGGGPARLPPGAVSGPCGRCGEGALGGVLRGTVGAGAPGPDAAVSAAQTRSSVRAGRPGSGLSSGSGRAGPWDGRARGSRRAPGSGVRSAGSGCRPRAAGSCPCGAHLPRGRGRRRASRSQVRPEQAPSPAVLLPGGPARPPLPPPPALRLPHLRAPLRLSRCLSAPAMGQARPLPLVLSSQGTREQVSSAPFQRQENRGLAAERLVKAQWPVGNRARLPARLSAHDAPSRLCGSGSFRETRQGMVSTLTAVASTSKCCRWGLRRTRGAEAAGRPRRAHVTGVPRTSPSPTAPSTAGAASRSLGLGGGFRLGAATAVCPWKIPRETPGATPSTTTWILPCLCPQRRTRPAPRWWPRKALRLPRPSPGSQNQAFASLSPSPTSLCLGLKRRAGHPGWHRPAHTQAPRVRTCPDTEDSWRGPGAGAWEPRRGPQPTRLLLRTWGDQNKGPLSQKRASALEHA